MRNLCWQLMAGMVDLEWKSKDVERGGVVGDLQKREDRGKGGYGIDKGDGAGAGGCFHDGVNGTDKVFGAGGKFYRH